MTKLETMIDQAEKSVDLRTRESGWRLCWLLPGRL